MFHKYLIPIVCSSILYAVEPISSTCSVHVEELISKTLSSHPSIKMSRQIIKGADAQVDGAKWNYFPTPSVDYSQASGRRNGVTARLDQPLWTGGKLDSTMDITLSQKNASEFALDESGYTLMSNLLNLLQSYSQLEGSVEALVEGKKQLEVFEQMLNRRIDAGVSSFSDHELIKSRLSQINSDLSVARTRLRTVHSQIELLIGEPIGCVIEFSDEKVLSQNIPIERMIEEMMGSHPSLKKLSAQIKTAEAEKAKAKAALWPTVSLRAEHQSGSVYSDQSTTNNLVYVTLQATPGAGLSALSNIESAEAKVLQTQFEKLAKEREITDALMKDYNEYRAATDRIDGLEKTVRSTQSVLESYTRLFIAGKRQWLDLVNTSREVTQNRQSLAELKGALAVMAYRLSLYRGEIKPEFGEMK